MFAVYLFDALVQGLFGIYWLWPSFDVPMHTLGGIVSAWTGYRLWLLLKKEGFRLKPEGLLYVGLIGWTSFVGIMWEFYEFIHDRIYPWQGTSQPSVADTMGDFFFDLMGAVLFCLVLCISLRKNKKKRRR